MRTEDEIKKKLDEVWDKTWYLRHRSINGPVPEKAGEILAKYGTDWINDFSEEQMTGILICLNWVNEMEWNEDGAGDT